MAEAIFKNRTPNGEKLLAFGFVTVDDGYWYRTELVGGQLLLGVRVTADGTVETEVTDSANGEEYVLHRVSSAAGSFVGRVKAEIDAALEDIAARCFDIEVFQSEQAKAVLSYVRVTYGDEAEYLWEKFPDNAVVRRRDNRKWYIALLTVARAKLGSESDGTAEILDLRMRPEELEATVDHRRYFPGYHMNKKHWVTICLDGSLPTEEILRRIDESYRLAKK